MHNESRAERATTTATDRRVVSGPVSCPVTDLHPGDVVLDHGMVLMVTDRPVTTRGGASRTDARVIHRDPAQVPDAYVVRSGGAEHWTIQGNAHRTVSRIAIGAPRNWTRETMRLTTETTLPAAPTPEDFTRLASRIKRAGQDLAVYTEPTMWDGNPWTVTRTETLPGATVIHLTRVTRDRG